MDRSRYHLEASPPSPIEIQFRPSSERSTRLAVLVGKVLPLLRQHLEEIPRRGLSNALMALAYLELWHSEGNGWCEEIQGNPQVLRRVVFALEDGIQQAMFHFCVGWKVERGFGHHGTP